MVTRKEVCDAADRIRARDASPGGVKERVSVRSVRKEVGRGSFGDIARELGHWRKDANYHPVIERADLPEALQSRLTTLGKELLEQARIEATRERLADFADVERRREECDRIVAEAADRVDALEERVARLQSELDRSGGVRASVTGMPAAPGLADPPVGPRTQMGVFVDTLYGLKLAQEAEDYWNRVREAVKATLVRRGPLAVHPLLKALPTSLKAEGERVGFPLTEAWLRYRLVQMSRDCEGLTLVDHRFGVVEAQGEEAEVAGLEGSPEEQAAAMGSRAFWVQFLRQVHDLLVEKGALGSEDILSGLDRDLVRATRAFQEISPRLLRKKLRQRIGDGRPFVEVRDKLFEAVVGDGPWDGESPTSVYAPMPGQRSA